MWGRSTGTTVRSESHPQEQVLRCARRRSSGDLGSIYPCSEIIVGVSVGFRDDGNAPLGNVSEGHTVDVRHQALSARGRPRWNARSWKHPARRDPRPRRRGRLPGPPAREGGEEDGRWKITAATLDVEGESELECARRSSARRSASGRAWQVRDDLSSPGSSTRGHDFEATGLARSQEAATSDEIEVVGCRRRDRLRAAEILDEKTVVALLCSRPAAPRIAVGEIQIFIVACDLGGGALNAIAPGSGHVPDPLVVGGPLGGVVPGIPEIE